ncbi:MAG: hypothetical protein ABL308_06665 [Oceanicaulis sp.]
MFGRSTDTILLDTLMDSAIGVSLIDRDHRVVRTNAAMDEVNGFACGPNGFDPAREMPDVFAVCHEHVEAVLQVGEPVLCAEITRSAPDGGEETWVCDFLPVMKGDQVEHVMALVRRGRAARRKFDTGAIDPGVIRRGDRLDEARTATP